MTLTRPNGETVILSDEFRDITAITLSSDNVRMYIGDKTRKCIYTATVEPDGTFGRPLIDKHPSYPDTVDEPKQTSYYDR